MTARQFHAKLRAAAKAFKAAGGQNPLIRVDGETIEIREQPPNSTDTGQADRTQALIEERLGGSRSPK